MERRRKHGYVTLPCTALDELGSELRREKEQALPSGFVSDDIVGSEEDIEDVVFQCAILPERTGNFDLDFPKSPRISKGKGKTSESAPKNTSPKLNPTVPISASGKAGPMQTEVKAAPLQRMCKNKVLIMIWMSMETLDLLDLQLCREWNLLPNLSVTVIGTLLM